MPVISHDFHMMVCYGTYYYLLLPTTYYYLLPAYYLLLLTTCRNRRRRLSEIQSGGVERIEPLSA